MTDTFLSTKADKQRIRHSSFVTRITKPSSSSFSAAAERSRTKNAKRHARKRDQQKVLASTTALDSLAKALPTLTSEEVRAGETERSGRIRHKSLRSRPGALKKKERVVRGEMERFGLSLAQLASVKEEEEEEGAQKKMKRDKAAGVGVGVGVVEKEEEAEGRNVMMDMDDGVQPGEVEAAPQPAPTSVAANRFAALRGFITATMEQNPAFMQRPDAAKGS